MNEKIHPVPTARWVPSILRASMRVTTIASRIHLAVILGSGLRLDCRDLKNNSDLSSRIRRTLIKLETLPN